jgi:hypothetical protein
LNGELISKDTTKPRGNIKDLLYVSCYLVKMRPPALNDLSIVMSVIGLREHYENLSAQKRTECRSSKGVGTTPSVKSVATLFNSQLAKGVGVTFVGRELF